VCVSVCVYYNYIICIRTAYYTSQPNPYYERRTRCDIDKCVYSLRHIIIIWHEGFKINPMTPNNNLVK